MIGVPDEKWDERPLACVVLKEGAELTPQGLSEYLQDKVAKWWIPERWTFIDEVPKTSVGKYDKKVLRSRHEAGELDVQRWAEPRPPSRRPLRGWPRACQEVSRISLIPPRWPPAWLPTR